MDAIERTIDIYSRLRKNEYRVEIENGVSFSLRFWPEHYRHLIGAHHLTDLPAVVNKDARQFYSAVKSGKITESDLCKSSKYQMIAERITTFESIEEMMQPGECKLIIDFDESLLTTKINADYSLFKRASKCYHHLFLGSNGGVYHPITYIVEPSKRYISEQIILSCTITKI